MRCNVRAPVAQLRSSQSCARAMPRISNFQGLRQSAFLGGSCQGICSTVSARFTAPSVRGSRLVVEAVKKSVGDLSKADLEGKTVLVRHEMYQSSKFRWPLISQPQRLNFPLVVS